MVRLHPEALKRLQARSDYQHGRKSGMAAIIRQIVYREIGFNSAEWDATHQDGGEEAPEDGL